MNQNNITFFLFFLRDFQFSFFLIKIFENPVKKNINILYMPIPIDKDLYNKVKEIADNVYKKSSAYKSMYIQKLYQKYGGEYEEDGEEPKLKRWIDEKWRDIGNKDYPVYRPTIRINPDTPLLVSEIDKKNLKKQINLKQKIKGNENLPKFKPK
jgi:hypothetical protein